MELLGEAIDAFKGASQKDRDSLLKALFQNLRPSEKYSLYNRLLEDRFVFDILGNLPIEIGIQVAEYLDPREVIRFRQVSSQWMFLFSSKELARSLIRIHYATRSDLPDYSCQIEVDPFSALRNLAFREHAGRTGLFRVRTQYNLGMTRLRQNTFLSLGHSANLRYTVLAQHSHSSAEHSQWYLVDMEKSPSSDMTPLINRQREAMDEGSLHIGEHCIAAITLNSSRAVVWDMDGKLLYGFKLAHHGCITMGSSERYLVIRNEHAGALFSDYYLFDLSSKVLKVFEETVDSLKKLSEASREQRKFAQRPLIVAMTVLGDTQRIVLAANVGKNEVAVNWLQFGEGNDALLETNWRIVNVKPAAAVSVDYRPYPVVFRKFMNASFVNIYRGHIQGASIELTKPMDTGVSAFLEEFNGSVYDIAKLGPLYSPGPSFHYCDTIYVVIWSKLGDTPHTDYLARDKYELWCSGRGRSNSEFQSQILDLEVMGGDFQSMGVTDKGFLLFFDEGLLLYEWLDFDGSREQQKDDINPGPLISLLQNIHN